LKEIIKKNISKGSSINNYFYMVASFSAEELEKLLVAKIMEKTPSPPNSILIDVSEMLKDQLAIMGKFFEERIVPLIGSQSQSPLESLIRQLFEEINKEIDTYDPPSSTDQRKDQVRAILFYRIFKTISSDNFRQESDIDLFTGYPIDLKKVKFILNIIGWYRSDPDRDDIIRDGLDNHKFVYYITRNIRPDWWKSFFNSDTDPSLFVRAFIDTGLGRAQQSMAEEDDPDDRVILTNDKLYNILFSNFLFSTLAALVFPFWPIKATTDIPVYVGTGPIVSDANCLNFKISNIQPGQPIDVYAPITSSSNDKSLAVRKFLKPGGVILEIILHPGSPYMCVSEEESDERETFVLLSQYIFVKNKMDAAQIPNYTFNQVRQLFLDAALIMSLWVKAKSSVNSYVDVSLQPYIDIEGERATMKRLITIDFFKDLFEQKIKGGSNPNRKTKRKHYKSKRQTNKKRKKTNKKRRTNKRRTNKRRRI
jgi:hypothetical protein